MPNMVAKLTYVFDGGGAMHSQFCISPTIPNIWSTETCYNFIGQDVLPNKVSFCFGDSAVNARKDAPPILGLHERNHYIN